LTAETWWLTLLQGAAAAFIGLVGAVLVFWLTRRHDNARAAEQRRVESEGRAQEERANAVADVAGAAAYLIRDLTTPPFFRVRAYTDLLAATLRFVAVTKPRHPDVALWALTQHQLLSGAQSRYRKRWLIPFGGKRRLQAWVDPAGQLGGRLIEWHVGDLDDSWFVKDLERLSGAGPIPRRNLDRYPRVAQSPETTRNQVV
jgi:hypothetical protein